MAEAVDVELLRNVENPLKFQWGVGGAGSIPPVTVHGFDSALEPPQHSADSRYAQIAFIGRLPCIPLSIWAFGAIAPASIRLKFKLRHHPLGGFSV
jgi:hypothetical protein